MSELIKKPVFGQEVEMGNFVGSQMKSVMEENMKKQFAFQKENFELQVSIAFYW